MKKFVVIRTQFEALHSWSNCPFVDVAFLRNTHRHIFHVEVKYEISKDREVEFIRAKRELNAYIKKIYEGRDLKDKSCEIIAEEIMNWFKADFVSIFEDGENGAEITRT